MLQQELEKIGLTEKEAKVYLAALELGQAPVQDISKKSGVNRATTYVILESLMKKGIISTTEQGKKRLFVAEAPTSLKNVIEDQQKQLKSKESLLSQIMPQLRSVYNLHPNKPVVRFYEGKDGLKSIREEFLNSEPESAYMFFPVGDVKDLFTESEREEHRKKRERNKTKIQAIYIDQKGEKLKRSEKLAERRIVPADKFKLESDIVIFNDKVSIASLKGQVSGVIIESKAIADTFKSIFELAFESADKYDTEFQKSESGKEAEIDVDTTE